MIVFCILKLGEIPEMIKYIISTFFNKTHSKTICTNHISTKTCITIFWIFEEMKTMKNCRLKTKKKF